MHACPIVLNLHPVYMVWGIYPSLTMTIPSQTDQPSPPYIRAPVIKMTLKSVMAHKFTVQNCYLFSLGLVIYGLHLQQRFYRTLVL